MTHLNTSVVQADRDRDLWQVHAGPGVDLPRLLDGLPRGSLPEALRDGAERHPDLPALTVACETLTFGELAGATAKVAGWLRGRIDSPGRRLLIAAPTSTRQVLAYLGALQAQMTVVPVDAGIGREELETILMDAEPTVTFTEGPAAEILASIDHRPELALSIDEALLAPPLAAAPPVAPMMLAYTSGSTGRPKGVLLSHGNVLSSIRAAMAAWRWSPDDVLVHCLPLSHQHGLSGVHAAILAGSHTVVLPAFDPDKLGAAIEAERATVLFGVPAIYARLDAWEGASETDFSSLRLAVSGSAPLSPELAASVEGRLGISLLERYGSTEAGLDLSAVYDGERPPGCVGLPLPGVEAKVVGTDGEDLSHGTEGELVVRGPQVFGGYWRRPEEDAAAFLGDGWFRTGDLAEFDGAEWRITGRLKELIITGGLNVHPVEVERVLERHDGLARVAVAGVPSERWGEEVVAFVIPAASTAPAESELLQYCRARLAAFKCPKRVIVVSELPVNSLGKVQRRKLGKLAVADGGAAQSTRESDGSAT
ncbi:MAG: AMP-binding protein [Actinobacteria bacterium]|nr:AMP-binding protein [Actinomycetota bacterium]